ncbi:hypothetical protein PBRA_009307 [Plasmodiophora brassicae]|uniref:RapA2 cadherin-like domain-containing protein n=1 Tax=Plasmodiophora brassicae TaxID=37360 RepID=A0A0G4J6S4_PLABS|nr:hypothetical protein PBRA_009307 [Plasmodiophora brassicae]
MARCAGVVVVVVAVVLLGDVVRATNANSIAVSSVTSSWAPTTTGMGYNVSLVCGLTVSTYAGARVSTRRRALTLHGRTAYVVNVSVTSSWLSVAPARLGTLSSSRSVALSGELVSPAVAGTSLVATVVVAWTTSTLSSAYSGSASTTVTLSRATNQPPTITSSPIATTENAPVLLSGVVVADADFYDESDRGVMTLTATTVTAGASLSIGALDAALVGATVVSQAPTQVVLSCGLSCMAQADTTLRLGGNLSFVDVDAGAGEILSLTASAVNGSFRVVDPASLNYSVAVGAHALTAWGNQTMLRARLSHVVYVPAPAWNTWQDGLDHVTLAVTDGHGASGSLTVDVNVTYVDQAPVVTVAASLTTNEDAPVRVTIGVSDASVAQSSGNGVVGQVVVQVGNGSLSLRATAGLYVRRQTSSTIQFEADMTAMNAALDPLTYTPAADWSGVDTLHVAAGDLAGGPWTNVTVPITVVAVNDAPVVSMRPAPPLNGTERAPVYFNVSVVDVDDTRTTVSLASPDGTFTLATHAGVNVSAVSATTTTVSGPIGNVVAALSPVAFTSNQYRNGFDCAATIAAVDPHGASSAVVVVPLQIAATHDPPVITTPPALSVPKRTNLTVASVSVYSADDDNVLRLRLMVTQGSLTLSTRAGLTFLTGTGLQDTTTVVQGHQAALNAAMSGMTFTPSRFFFGNASLSVTVNDTWTTAGPVTVPIVVRYVATGADLACAAAFVATEDTWGAVGSVTIDDLPAANRTMTLTATAGQGVIRTTMHLAGVSVFGNGTASLQMVGAYSLLNQALGAAALQYKGNPDTNWLCCGPDTITYNVSYDGVATLCQSSVIVGAVGDPPALSTRAVLQASYGAPANLGDAINITDPDAGESDAAFHSLTLLARDGSFVYTSAGLTSAGLHNDGATSHSVQVSGPLSRITNALRSGTIMYNASAVTASADLINVTVADLIGGYTVQASMTVTKMVVPPVLTVAGAPALTTLEDTPVNVSVTVVSANAAPAPTLISCSATNALASLTLVQASTTNVRLHSQASSSTLVVNATVSTTALTFHITYVPSANWNSATSGGPDVVTFSIGGAFQASIEVDVTAVNDAPVVVASSYALSVDEDAPVTLCSVVPRSINVSDVDAGETISASMTAQVHTYPQTGTTLTLNSDLGLYVAIDQPAFKQLSGSPASVSAALSLLSVTFTGFFGAAFLYVNVSDQGNTGLGGVLWSNITIGIRVVHVDHPPTLTLQGALPLQLVEDAPFTFNGTLGHVDSNAGLTFNASISGGPYLSAWFPSRSTFVSGSFAAVSAALSNVTIQPIANWNGVTASFSVSVSVGVPAPDAPVLTLNCSTVAVVDEDVPVMLAPGALITSIVDADHDPADDAQLWRLTFNVTHGTLTVMAHQNTFFYAPLDVLLHLSALSSLALTYTPPPFYNGADALRVTVNDTTTGTPTSSVTCPITVRAVPNAVVIGGLPDVIAVVEDRPAFVFPNVTVARQANENASTVLTCTVTARAGALSNTIAPSANTSAIQAALRALVYTPAVHSTADDYVMIQIALPNGAHPATYVGKVVIAPVDHAPVVTLPYASVTTTEDVPLVITGINLTDVDDDEATMVQMNISAGHGAVTLNGTGGLQVVGVDIVAVRLGTAAARNLTVNVTAVVDPLTMTQAAYAYATTQATGVAVGQVTLHDVDAVTSQCTVSAAHGSLTPNANYTWLAGSPFTGAFPTNASVLARLLALTNAFTYTPSPAFYGTDQVTITAKAPLSQASATFDIIVSPVASRPNVTTTTTNFTVVAGAVLNVTGVSCADPDWARVPDVVVPIVVAPSFGSVRFTAGGFAPAATYYVAPALLSSFWASFEYVTMVGTAAGVANITVSVFDSVGTAAPATTHIRVNVVASPLANVAGVTRPTPEIRVPFTTTMQEGAATSPAIAPINITSCPAGNVTAVVVVGVPGATLSGAVSCAGAYNTSGSTTTRWQVLAPSCDVLSACLSSGALRVTPPARLNGLQAAMLSISVYQGGALVTTADVAVNITAVNDAPTIAAPAQGLRVVGGLPAQLGAGYYAGWPLASPIVVSDSDLDETFGALMLVRVAVGKGVVSLLDRAGLSFVVGDGLADADLAFYASRTMANLALTNTSLLYGAACTTPGLVISDWLNVTVDDLGNTGAGGALVARSTSALTVHCP